MSGCFFLKHGVYIHTVYSLFHINVAQQTDDDNLFFQYLNTQYLQYLNAVSESKISKWRHT